MLTSPRTIRTLLALSACAALTNQPRAQSAGERPPIIDVHLHAYDASQWKGSQPNPVTGKPGPATADEHMRETLAAMERYNIVKAIVSGPLESVERWRTAAPARILASPLFGRPGVDFSGRPLSTLADLRRLFTTGRLSAIGEVVAQYEGLSPSDPTLDPYFALAEELDIPVYPYRHEFSGHALSRISAFPAGAGQPAASRRSAGSSPEAADLHR
jgi:uncharacterized protein